MDKIRSLYIKYKFIFNENIKYTSYNYQKIFRSIYGYQQNVTKKEGKIYVYYRDGVLSYIPYIKQGKGEVILPLQFDKSLIHFFDTGENPAHIWKTKGDWKVDYKINEIEVSAENIVSALIDVINKKTASTDNVYKKLSEILSNIASNGDLMMVNNKQQIVDLAKKIITTNWFLETYNKSEELTSFYSNYQKIINTSSNYH
jgi:hypothetical protein